MSFYLLILESFFYGVAQSILDSYQDFLIKLPDNTLSLKCILSLYSLLFFIFILRIARLFNNYVETLIFLIFIADTDSMLKNVALGTAIIFNASSFLYYITVSYILAYELKLHNRYYTEAFINKMGDLLDKNYTYVNIPNYLLYYICNDQKY